MKPFASATAPARRNKGSGERLSLPHCHCLFRRVCLCTTVPKGLGFVICRGERNGTPCSHKIFAFQFLASWRDAAKHHRHCCAEHRPMSDAKSLFVLHEAAAGYALFEVVQFEEIGALLEGAMDTVTDLDKFSRAVKLKSFQPFESAEDALSNMNAVSEHACTDGLTAFLEMNLPKIKKKKKTAPPFF
ncbi:hypothetical protein THAOC_33467, partial [Thalassiosira oceanica]